MGDLSKHFSRHEFRCRGVGCCGGSGAVDERLIVALEELWRRCCVETGVHRVSVMVNSGFRCERHNREVGGSENSEHCVGHAADIRCDAMSAVVMADLAERVEGFREGGVGRYDDFVHVDVRRSGPARW